MKTYKYTINGTQYEVAIGDIADNIATVTVNGEEYKVEMEPEAEPEKKKVVVTMRNPHVYLGKRINVNRKDDGTLYPTFNRPRYTKDFAFQDFCREAAEELLAVAGLVEEG